MKKKISVIIALVMVLAIAVPVMAACTPDKNVSAIAVVDPVTTYKVDDVIDYDALKIKVSYDDNTSETKTVGALKATVNKADLSKEGNSSYTITYQGKTATVNIVVEAKNVVVPDTKIQVNTFVEPAFYTNYKTKSADRGAADEARADFRVTGEIYEVGNLNKLIFRPSATGLDIEQHKTVTISNVKTTAKVFSKGVISGTYAELTGDDLTSFVSIENNTYKFTEEAAGKYVKLEISIDAEEYDVEALEEENRTLTVEFVVVDGGYNVYDQLGLTVMCDMQKQVWSPLWGATATYNETTHKYDLSAKQDGTPVQLEADDQPLYTFVGNVQWVILHSNLTLDASQMPSEYFWSDTEDSYNTALQTVHGLDNLEGKLNGSLKDGLNDGQRPNYTKDLIPGTTTAAETGISINMQNGLFASNKVSVSGNYNSIIVPEYKEGERHFNTVVDWGDDDDTKPANPVSHWAVFQIHMSADESGLDAVYNIKNLAMTGNNAKDDISADEKAKGTPAGMLMVNCYSNHMTFNNTVSEKFFTNIVVDGYGDQTGVEIINSKMYDSFSNMCYMWRSTVTIENSELIGAGGPLFILCDGQSHFVGNNHTDEEGANMTVDKTSVLQSYATGQESWYATYDAQALVGQFTGPLNTLLGNFGKTIVKKQNSLNYVNVIAVIICSPGKLMAGDSDNLIDVCGTFTTKNDSGVVDQFMMHNQTLVTLRAAVQNNATMFPVILQVGNLFAYNKGDANLYKLGATSEQAFDPATDGVAWATDTHDKICVYMSAASQSKSKNAPYFGVILDIMPLQGN